MTPGRPASGERRGDRDASGEGDPERQEAPAPVREATPERRDHHLDRRGPDEGGRDRGRAPAGGAEIERHEHRDDAEENGRHDDQPEGAEDDRLPERAEIRARGLRIRRRRRGPQRPADEDDRDPGDRREGRSRDRATSATAPTAGPSSAPKIAAPIAVPIISPAPLARRPGHEPREAPGPGERAADPLGEARDCRAPEPSPRTRRRRSRRP